MSEVLIDVRIFRDIDLIPTSIEYNIIGLKKNTWLGVFVNDIRVFRFRTNQNGEASGTISPVPTEYHNDLISLGDFINTIRLTTYVAESGVIAGISDVVEDTDNEGLPNIGAHEINLRYD